MILLTLKRDGSSKDTLQQDQTMVHGSKSNYRSTAHLGSSAYRLHIFMFRYDHLVIAWGAI